MCQHPKCSVPQSLNFQEPYYDEAFMRVEKAKAMGGQEGVGVVRGKALKLEEVKSFHTL
jgi:hypothetical protein